MDEVKKEDTIKKSNLINSRLGEWNLILTLAVKILILIGLIVMFYTGQSVYKQYAHYGPSCIQQQSAFQAWLDNSKGDKGKVVSIHGAKLQIENGTTKCYGNFLTKSGQYKNWKGSITELSNGDVIGNASLY